MHLLRFLVIVALPVRLLAQHEGHDMPPASGAPLGIPDNRIGSGTAWLPDASPMHAVHLTAGRWSLMRARQGTALQAQ